MAGSKRQSVAVIDYGMGNLHSVAKALEHLSPGLDVRVTHEPERILEADRVILPGVGAIRDCIGEIRRLGMDQVVADVVAQGQPLLGICVGLQALLEHSEENGGVECLGLLPGHVRYFGQPLHDDSGRRLKVPHMGWNEVRHDDHPLWRGIAQDSRFYFVHSYYVECRPERGSDISAATQIAGTCQYGLEFAAALSRGSIFAVQFHPEKSHTAGLTLLQNFLSWGGA